MGHFIELPLSLRRARVANQLERPDGFLVCESNDRFHPRTDPANPSVRAARAKCGTSRYRRCIPKLPRLLRNSDLQGPAKSPRCEIRPELAPARTARPLEFPARPTDRTASRLHLQFRAAHGLLRVRRQ